MSLADQQWCPTSVQVTVHQARGLRIKGKSGTNDAYAVMQVGKEKYQTSVVEKTVAPMWKEEAAFDLHQGGGGGERSTLHVHVLHRALVGPDKLLGHAVINLLQLSKDKTRNKTEWFKLLDKTGKLDKDRGEVLVDIQFMRNNMTASMFDISAAGKSRSRLGKFKDKVRGKKRESDDASTVVPSFNQVLTDSEDDGEVAAGKEEKKKKHKIKSLFSPKSNLQKNMSQSMSVLPAKNSSLSGSQSSGLSVNSSEGKKKFKFMIHKRSGSSDSKDSTAGQQKDGSVEQSNLCINGSHIYSDEQPRTARIGSNFSLASSGLGSMEDVPESSPPSVDSLRAVRQYSPWMEEEEEEEAEIENKGDDMEEMRVKEEKEKMWIEKEKHKGEEEERIRSEARVRKEEEERERLAEEKRRLEEQEKMRVEEEERIRMEEESAQEEKRREEEDRVRRQEHEKKKRLEEEEMRQREEERIRKEEYERLLEEKGKLEEEERKRTEEENIRREEEERKRIEEARRRKVEEAERVRWQEEQRRIEEKEKRQREEEEKIRKEEERRKQEQEEMARKEMERLVEEKRKLDEEKKRIEEEDRIRREEQERIRMEEERAEEERRRRQEEEERVRKEKERLVEEKRKLDEEKKRIEEEDIIRREEQERIRMEEERAEEERRRREEEEERLRKEKEEIERLVEEKRKLDEEKNIEEEEKTRTEEEQRKGHGASGKHRKVAVERSPAEVSSTNPFEEDFSNNPFESLNSPAGPNSSKVLSVQQRCQSPEPSVGSTTVSDGKEVTETHREKRQAPQPPGRDEAKRQSQREPDASTQHPAQNDKQSKGKDVKTASVLPQRSLQMNAPLSRSSTNTENNQSLTQSSTTEGTTATAAKHTKRPAPSRPRSMEEEQLPEPKTSHGHDSEAKQVPVVYGLNPFDEDDDDITACGDSGSVLWPPAASQAHDKDDVSQTKIKSSKIAHAPPPPVTTAATSSALNKQNTDGACVTDGVIAPDNNVTQTCDPEIEAIHSVPVQESPLQESQPVTVQHAGEEESWKKEHPHATSRRLQPVKPLNPLEQQSVSVVQGQKDNKSTGILCEVQENTKVNDTEVKGLYSQLTQKELISLVLKQESQLSERDRKILELEQYIDNILVRVIEEKPSILMSMNFPKSAV
ncbi:hypothetical protein PAMA_007855 [Pampus argenteus]